jgi:membrane-bound lytic murein transglycosylase C
MNKKLLILSTLILSIIILGCSTRGPGTWSYEKNQKIKYDVKDINQKISKECKKYNIDTKLVKAIIKTESNYNPKAISRTGALGLMQIRRNTAGIDVNQKIFKINTKPTKEELLNPYKNIKYGVAYLYILKNKYLKGIKNKRKKELCMIASYNGGAGALLRTFDKDKKKAINKINKMSFYKLYETILLKHNSDETKKYITKVLTYKEKY